MHAGKTVHTYIAVDKYYESFSVHFRLEKKARDLNNRQRFGRVLDSYSNETQMSFQLSKIHNR
jgi:ribosomal protein L44E